MTKYNPKEFEDKWIQKWLEDKTYTMNRTVHGKTTSERVRNETSAGRSKYEAHGKFYSLYSFPYPSGAGLHVGHAEGMVANDIVARYWRMKGKDVLFPMGWDSFGLPAENYAIKTGTPPQQSTEEAVKTFIGQINKLGIGVDWDTEVGAHRPDYYKWTQWIFLQLFKNGLAYKKKAPVNWCPKDQTVLANEQVINGKCERCDTEVIQKEMEQWFFKITDFADRLDKDLDKVDWPEGTKAQQRNWIGKSSGAKIKFQIIDDSGDDKGFVEIFTTRVDTIYSGAFIVLAPENELITNLKNFINNYEEVKAYAAEAVNKTDLQRQQEKDKTGIKIEGIMAINPATEKQIPIYAGDFVLGGYGTGAIFGDVHDERDFVFVKKFNISAKPSIVPEDPVEAQKVLNLEYCFTDYGILVDSGEFTGMKSLDAKEKITDYFIDKGIGSREVNYRLRDWLVSRQRYWGCPIPIVYDPEGNAHAVSEDDLPVLLPTDVDFKPTGESPITRSEDYKKRAEEKYGKGWHYEADTMDTFVDSSWYFFRHTDAKDHTQAFDTEKLNYWLPVDLYMIGAEHTVLHLLYSRFFTKFFYDQGVIKFDEPFYLMRHMGTILGPDGKKMSKRWGNVINPNDEIAKYSADTVRMYEMFMGPLEEAKPWNDRAENGVFRFLSKVWELQDKVNDFEDDSQTIQVNKLVQKVSWDIEHLSFNTSVAKFMEFVNFLGNQEKISKNVWEIFMKLLAPFAPFITEELWSILGYTDSIHLQEWPKFNPDLDQEEDITMAVQVNGKVRGTIIINKSADESEALNLAKTDTNIAKYLVTEPKKVIYVKGRILNIII